MFQAQVSLKEFTTLKVGGPAEFFVAVATEADLVTAVKEAKDKQIPFRVIGGGSNILVSDDGLPGLTIKNDIKGLTVAKTDEKVTLSVGAGEVLDDVIAQTVSKKYWGLENLSHIPGSFGATPIQNVGAYGVEIGSLIKKVRVLDAELMEFKELTKEQCEFGYRHSIFKQVVGKKFIVTNVTCELSSSTNPRIEYKDLAAKFTGQDMPAIDEIRTAVIDIRANKFPDWTKVGTAGSFFKNPIVRRVTYERLRSEYPGLPGFDVSDIEVKLPLGWILDNVCGLRGITRGNVGTYAGQALVLINNGSATATEITEFAEFVVDSVFSKTGIRIEWEVTKLE